MSPPSERPALREVRYEHTSNFAEILQHAGVSLFVSTYQAGKVLVLGSHGGAVKVSFLDFDRAMGLAASQDSIAIGTRRQIHFLHSAREIASQIEPKGTHDACWAIRSSSYTGNIHGHDLAWGTEGLWVVNTLFSTLCTLHEGYNFVPRWRPPFITELIDQDRCHLNGLALEAGVPKYVTCLAQTNDPAGWRPNKATSGCILEVPSGEAVVSGLSMPHSPRVYQNRLWVLNSGLGSFGSVDTQAGRYEHVEPLPGYTRGLSFAGQFAFVGLSKIRETNVFGGLPIAEKASELRCGVAIIDLVSGRTVSVFQFHSGVEEIFAVEAVPGSVNPAVFGMPDDQDDDHPEVWVVPPQEAAPTKSRNAFSAGELVERGNRAQDRRDVADALACYRQAIQVNPNCSPARQNLAYLLFNEGETEKAAAEFDELLRLDPSPMNRLLDALLLPVVYQSAEEVTWWRNRLESRLQAMVNDGISIDTTNTLAPTLFHLAYQGKNDRFIAETFGHIVRGPSATRSTSMRSRDASNRIRVGFLSAYFRDHTIGRLNLGRLQGLDRNRFEVVVLYAGGQHDEMVAKFHAASDQWISIPRNIQDARRLIGEAELDVLVFADVGMDSLTSTLVHSRMAPIQCATWGHPSTTGSDKIDYFISSQLLETPNAAQHYSEALGLLPLLGVQYKRPILGRDVRAREYFGLDASSHVYLCPQTLFKFHPDFDAVIDGVLRKDPKSVFAVVEGRSPAWTEQLCARWKRTLGSGYKRVRWISPQPHEDFLSLLRCADVILDPIHFGGGNTTYEAIAMGIPVVSLPGDFLRNRITAAIYHKMGITSCLVKTPEEYVQLAVRIATDKEFARQLRAEIAENSHRVFDDEEETLCFGEFLSSIASVDGLTTARVATSHIQ